MKTNLPLPATDLFRDFTWQTCALVTVILLMSTYQIYSATINTSFHNAYYQHLVWILLGVVAFFLFSFIDYHKIIEFSFSFYGIGILFLLVLFFTDPVKGTRRWLETPFGFSIQVSEYMKLVLVLVLAYCCKGNDSKRLHWQDYSIVGLLIVVPVGMTFLQPDLGTALSMLPLLGMVIYLFMPSWKHLIIIALIVVLLIPLSWLVLQPYQKDRILSFLNPSDSLKGDNYQMQQSNIAVGSGGLWGQGFVYGSQTQLNFLPNPHTDFILATFAEENGFVGIAFVLSLYYILLMRIVETAQTAADSEGTLIAMCVASLLLFHVLVNVGMVANKLPVTGLPLPLMSYGGSSLLVTMTMLGLVNSVYRGRYVN